MDEIRPAIGEEPLDRAQALTTRSTELLGRLMGQPLDPSATGFAASYPAAGTAAPNEADRPVWDVIHRALATRR
jgi:hypothetical protein